MLSKMFSKINLSFNIYGNKCVCEIYEYSDIWWKITVTKTISLQRKLSDHQGPFYVDIGYMPFSLSLRNIYRFVLQF